MQTFTLILITIIMFFVLPFINFACGFLAGLIIKVTIGTYIIAGLNLIGLNISLNSLPLFFATLAVIASFFKTSYSTKKVSSN